MASEMAQKVLAQALQSGKDVKFAEAGGVAGNLYGPQDLLTTYLMKSLSPEKQEATLNSIQESLAKPIGSSPGLAQAYRDQVTARTIMDSNLGTFADKFKSQGVDSPGMGSAWQHSAPQIQPAVANYNNDMVQARPEHTVDSFGGVKETPLARRDFLMQLLSRVR